MTEAPEPEGKLDAATKVVVNGPEDATLDWRRIDWRRAEAERTAVAAADLHGDEGGGPQEGPQPAEVDAAIAREHAVERAARDGAQRRASDGGRGRRGGAHPGGQDKVGRQGAALRRAVQGSAGQAGVHPQAREPKAPSARYPRDSRSMHQARDVNALEPEWEARFEPRSYGFRPGRGCHDAIQAIYEVVKGRTRNDGGRLTQIWPGRSTASPTTTF